MSQNHIRILLAKIGLDGHDRGVKVLARSLRDAGFDIIYTGLWQTSATTVHAALQEDADVIGVSLLSAAHMTIMPEILRLLREKGIDDTPVVLGGIVPEADYDGLRKMGVAAIFNPGSAMDDIIATFRELGEKHQRKPVDELLSGYNKGDVNCLAQLLTRLNRNGGDDGWDLPEGPGQVIGVTGAPGVGKSSFIAKLARILRDRGKKVAVIAVDPSSPITGGALLGDRLRMMSKEPDEAFYVRSFSSGTSHDGLAPNTKTAIKLLKGFGFDVILVETVGAGQTDVGIHKITNHVLLLLMPQTGDDIQFSKAGIMEIASGMVLNKADLPGADTAEAQIRSSISPDLPFWSVCTLRNEGIGRVADWAESL